MFGSEHNVLMFPKKRSNMTIHLHSSIVLYKQIIEEHQNQSIHESIIPMSCRTTVRVPIPQISYQKLKQSRSSEPASGGRQRRRRHCRGEPAKAVAAVQRRTGMASGGRWRRRRQRGAQSRLRRQAPCLRVVEHCQLHE